MIRSFPVISSCALGLLTAAFALAAPDQRATYAAITATARAANATEESITSGKFQPSFDSLKQYEFPEWFRDAKFGIWAHWGPQCQPEMGDWYAKNMYMPLNKAGKPNAQYLYHLKNYGHPSEFGFKDIIPLWTAEKWNPDKLVAFYKQNGARYFMAMANHHDNMDLWASKYQPWNSENLGPKKDLIAGWASATKAAGLPFGVSVHAGRAKGWLGVAKNADKEGPKAGVPYDGLVTAADGKGKWWDGLDPQDLYAQTTSKADYNRAFYNRTIDLVHSYKPDLLYFDDDYTNTGLPLYNTDPTVGLRIAADFYNGNLARTAGQSAGVIAAKKLSLENRKVLAYDIERGGAEEILPEPWQTDTCIGQWHYSKPLADRNGYRKAPEVVRMLADIVSKNGNLMLNIPVRGDGSIDDHEIEIVKQIGAWLAVNGEAIYATRPWKVYGEGAFVENAAVAVGTGEVIEKKVRPLGAEDIRYTVSKDGRTLYALVLGWPASGTVTLKSLANDAAWSDKAQLIGSSSAITARRAAEGLVLTLPAQKPAGLPEAAIAFKIQAR